MKTVIVLVEVSCANSKDVCDKICDQTFKDKKTLTDHIVKECDLSEEDLMDDYLIVKSLNEFTESVNNQDFEVLSSYFMAHATLEN